MTLAEFVSQYLVGRVSLPEILALAWIVYRVENLAWIHRIHTKQLHNLNGRVVILEGKT